RTAAPPTMTAFDAADRETCVVRPSRTNTPLQALAVLNGVTFVEAARVLAGRVMAERDGDEARLVRLFRLATGRTPTGRELTLLCGALERHRSSFAARPVEAAELSSVGEYPADPRLSPTEVAAFTAVANTVLNLDEVITRE